MQIDILSSNTLKLTLSRLDMFDLDIKYESLSGKNPETKKLLAHVLKTIRLDSSKAGFDFSCERIFVEAFPRPDGGCMLYVSGLESDNGRKRKSSIKSKDNLFGYGDYEDVYETAVTGQIKSFKVGNPKRENKKILFIFETNSLKELAGVCKNLCLQKQWERINFESSLFMSDNKAGSNRLIIKSEDISSQAARLLTGIVNEYGEVLQGERELMFTREHYNEIISENAVEKLNELL